MTSQATSDLLLTEDCEVKKLRSFCYTAEGQDKGFKEFLLPAEGQDKDFREFLLSAEGRDKDFLRSDKNYDGVLHGIQAPSAVLYLPCQKYRWHKLLSVIRYFDYPVTCQLKFSRRCLSVTFTSKFWVIPSAWRLIVNRG